MINFLTRRMSHILWCSSLALYALIRTSHTCYNHNNIQHCCQVFNLLHITHDLIINKTGGSSALVQPFSIVTVQWFPSFNSEGKCNELWCRFPVVKIHHRIYFGCVFPSPLLRIKRFTVQRNKQRWIIHFKYEILENFFSILHHCCCTCTYFWTFAFFSQQFSPSYLLFEITKPRSSLISLFHLHSSTFPLEL